MILSCDDVPAEPLPPAGVVVGVDVGIASFLTTSHGEHEPNPTCLERSADRLAAQRDLKRQVWTTVDPTGRKVVGVSELASEPLSAVRSRTCLPSAGEVGS